MSAENGQNVCLTGNLKVVFNVKSDTDKLHTIESICSSLR